MDFNDNKFNEIAPMFESIYDHIAVTHQHDIEQLETYEQALIPEVTREELVEEPVYTLQEQKEIQGNLIPGFKKDYQTFLFLQIGDLEQSKFFVKWVQERITNMNEVLAFKKLHKKAQLENQETEPAGKGNLSATWTNISFSHEGIRILAGEKEANSFKDEAFAKGMNQRAGLLGDPVNKQDKGNPENWLFGGEKTENSVHIMILIAADKKSDCEKEVEIITANAEMRNLKLVYQENAEAMPGDLKGHEHFGFKDGISDPAVRGKVKNNEGKAEYIYPRYIDQQKEKTEKDKDRYRYFAKPGQQLVWPGQFLVGEPRQDSYKLIDQYTQKTNPNFPKWARLGSYTVCRRLEQDVPAFWQFAEKVAKELKLDRNHFAAQMIGRWPSGSSLMRSPKEDDPKDGRNDLTNNHFLFDDKTKDIHLKGSSKKVDGTPDHDMLGLVCPHFAHIRKMHLRDSPTDLGPVADTATRLILRRGIPFGPSLWKDGKIKKEAINKSRGLMFVCYNTSIVEQFEFISNKWANSPIQPNLGGHDPVIGQTHASGGERYIDIPVVDAQAPLGKSWKRVEMKKQFVTPTGGEYFFTPPISALGPKGMLGGDHE